MIFFVCIYSHCYDIFSYIKYVHIVLLYSISCHTIYRKANYKYTTY